MTILTSHSCSTFPSEISNTLSPYLFHFFFSNRQGQFSLVCHVLSAHPIPSLSIFITFTTLFLISHVSLFTNLLFIHFPPFPSPTNMLTSQCCIHPTSCTPLPIQQQVPRISIFVFCFPLLPCSLFSPHSVTLFFLPPMHFTVAANPPDSPCSSCPTSPTLPPSLVSFTLLHSSVSFSLSFSFP